MKRLVQRAAAVAVMLLAACGSDSPSSANTSASTSTSTAAASTTVVAATTTTTPGPIPQKIVSISPTATETLYAIGAGDQVLAVDDQSNYPPEVLQKPHDLSGYQPNVEAIAALKPDLVLIGDDSSGISKQLDAVGLRTWVGEAATTFDQAYDQINQLGRITGHPDAAAQLVDTMQAEIAKAVQTAPKPATPLTYYHELDNTYYSITENTFIGQVYALFGMRSIADYQEVSSDYPQLSAESIISANPDVIFLADGNFGESAQTVAARPGWSALKAVKNGDIVIVDPDTSSRWGPRIVDFVQSIAAAVQQVVSHA